MNEVVTHGGGDVLYFIFNGVASITNGSTFADLTALSVAFAAGWIGFKAAFSTTNIRETALWFGGFLIFYQALLLPKSTVLITDKFNPAFNKTVDNVPYGLAFFASYTSSIGNGIAELFDQSFALPGDLSYSESGMLMGSKVFRDIQYAEVMDVEFALNLNSFIENCVLSANYITGGITNVELAESNDLWSLITEDNTLTTAAGIEYKDGSNIEYQSCKDAAILLDAKWADEVSDQTSFHFENLFKQNIDNGTEQVSLASLIEDSNNFFINSSQDASTLIRQSLMINAIKTASINMSTYADVVSAIETRKTYEMAALQATTWLPLVRTAVEAMLYGIFPFVFLLFLLPIGVKVFTNYIQALIWLQAWPPMYAVLHLIMTHYNQQGLIPYDEQDITIKNIESIKSFQEDLSLIAGYLMLMIPFLAMKLLNGFAGVGHMLGSMTGALQGASTTSVSEMTRGNYSQGNASFNNVSGNKHDTRFSSLSHGATTDNEYGAQITTFPDKVVTKMNNATDDHHMRINQNTSEKVIAGERADYSKKMGNHHESLAQKAYNQSFASALEFANRLEASEQSGESWTKNVDDQTRESLSNIKQYAEDNNVHVGAGGGFIVRAGTEFNVSSHDQESMSQDFEKIKRFSSESSSSIQNSEARSQLESTTSSYDEYQSNSETASKYYGVEKALSEYADSVKETGFDTNRDLTSDFTQSYLRKEKGYDDEQITKVMNDPDYVQSFERLVEQYRFELGNQMLESQGIEFIDDVKQNLNQASNDFKDPDVNFSNDNRESLKAQYQPNKLANTDIQDQVAMANIKNEQRLTEGAENIEAKSNDKVYTTRTEGLNKVDGYFEKFRAIDLSTGKLKNDGGENE